MNTSSKKICQEHSIKDIVKKYESVIDNNFQKRENELIQQLYDKAKGLKMELSFFKKEASQENVDKMISEKRREKQKERQILEGRWRQCTQSFKFMHEEQKKLISQQKESAFDLMNLRKKIEDFDDEIKKIKQRISPADHPTFDFMTEAKQNYKSPYKACSSLQQRQLDRIEKEHRLLVETQQHFFSAKYNKCQERIQREIRQQKVNSKESNYRLMRIEARYTSPQIGRQGQKCQDQANQTERDDYDVLLSFLENREVRVKLFGLLKKQH